MGRLIRSATLVQVILFALVLLASAEFVLRGPVRFAHAAHFNDFISPYIQTRAMLQGADPYSPQNLVRFWPPEVNHPDFLTKNLADGSLVYRRGIPTAYPLSALILISPVALLPWRIAQPLWLAISVGAFLITVAAVFSLAKHGGQTNRAYVLLALALALAPFHTGLAAGSIVIVAVAAGAAAVWSAERQRDALAGFLIAVALGLKPQIGLPFLLYYLVRRRWRISVVACLSAAILFVIPLLRLSVGATPWLESYLYDNRVLFARGSLGDFTEANPLRFGLINFQVAAYALLHNRSEATVVALIITAAAGLSWLSLVSRQPRLQNDWLELSSLAVLSLLPVYHRFYDASLLIFPLSWSLRALSSHVRTSAKAVLTVIILAFLVPGGSLLQQLQRTGHFVVLRNSWWWRAIVLPHESWSILVLSLLLLWAMQLQKRSLGAQLAAPE